ncbi:hypothetical protein FWC63_02030 [Candidatus Saccharibacteria bacterium]|nr:hypothetical protein [Candidatus Saccharibacteria bacterium]
MKKLTTRNMSNERFLTLIIISCVLLFIVMYGAIQLFTPTAETATEATPPTGISLSVAMPEPPPTLTPEEMMPGYTPSPSPGGHPANTGKCNGGWEMLSATFEPEAIEYFRFHCLATTGESSDQYAIFATRFETMQQRVGWTSIINLYIDSELLALLDFELAELQKGTVIRVKHEAGAPSHNNLIRQAISVEVVEVADVVITTTDGDITFRGTQSWDQFGEIISIQAPTNSNPGILTIEPVGHAGLRLPIGNEWLYEILITTDLFDETNLSVGDIVHTELLLDRNCDHPRYLLPFLAVDINHIEECGIPIWGA